MVWFDRAGRVISRVNVQTSATNGATLSPDGRQVAFQKTTDGNRDIWLTDLTRDVATRLTFDVAVEAYPVWSRDGTRVAFGSDRGHPGYNLYQKLANGTGAEELIFTSDLSKFPQDWSPDNRFLLFRAVDPKTGRDLWRRGRMRCCSTGAVSGTG